jgi:pyrroloquinoline quinone biosynthesis protein D
LKGRDLGDEYVFYDSSGEKLHILNGTAREIYLLCDGSRTLREVAGALAEMYEVEEETAREDVLRTARRLTILELLV